MKKFKFNCLLALLFFSIPQISFSQDLTKSNKTFDSLESSINSERAINKKFKLIFELGKNSSKSNAKRTADYGYEALKLSEKNHSAYGKAIGHLLLGLSYNF
ncbi:MAG: hypothetical protein K2Q22_05035, partial [Cytophagales bacterium]|nr:hypothetical protein [Cytophagales bacterium]